MITSEDKAYAAGVIDALANLRPRRAGKVDLPVIAVHGRHEPIQRWLAQATGSKVVLRRKGYYRHNCTDHCPEAHQHIVSETTHWDITGARATIVLFNVLPHLRAQRVLAAELLEIGLAVGYSGSVVNSMRALGWEIPELRDQPRARVKLVS